MAGLFGLSPVVLVIFPLVPFLFSLLWGNLGLAVASFVLALGIFVLVETLVNLIPLHGKGMVLDFIARELKGVRLKDHRA